MEYHITCSSKRQQKIQVRRLLFFFFFFFCWKRFFVQRILLSERNLKEDNFLLEAFMGVLVVT